MHVSNPLPGLSSRLLRPAAVLLVGTALLMGTTVAPSWADGEDPAADVATVSIHNADDVRGNVYLPELGASGSSLVWSSSDPQVVSATGEVTRPAPGSAPVDVELTVTASADGATPAAATISLEVQPLPAEEPLVGYVFPYFKGETTADGEKVYLAASTGNSPTAWTVLNDDEPVFTSTLGEEGLRDPFIMRSPEGDRFYLLATDLNMYANYNGFDFGSAQERGSHSLMVWESTDLVNWSDQRMVEVSSELAGNTWAPEAFYDETRGEYIVYWASALYDTAEIAGRDIATSYQRMMYATTRDFVHFSDPQVWVDEPKGAGRGMIDATIAQEDGTYHRIIKDEGYMAMRQDTSDDLRSTSWTLIKEKVGVGQPNPWGGTYTHGEGPSVFPANDEPGHWYLLQDQPSYHGGQGYMLFETDDLASAEWTAVLDADLPPARHGGIIGVTATELQALYAAYQPDAFLASSGDVALSVQVGDDLQLPATVAATGLDGATGDFAVVWEDVDPTLLQRVGTFTVEGAFQAAGNAVARAIVTVTEDAVPVTSLTVSPETLRVGVGSSSRLTATVAPLNATGRTVAWSTSDDAVAIVAADGTVTGVAAGTATITGTTADGLGTDTAEVTVVADGGPELPAHAWVDSFDADELGDEWTIHKPSLSNLSLTENPGSLTVHTLPGDVWQTANDYENVLMVEAPEGDFTAWVKLDQAVAANHNGAGLMAWQDHDNFVRTGVAHVSWAEGGPIVVEDAVERNASYSSTFTARPGSTTEWLRLQRTGNQVGLAHWDGTDWVTTSTLTVDFPLTEVGLWALAAGTAPSHTVTFEWFAVAGAEPAGPNPAADAAADLVVHNVDDVRGNLTLPTEVDDATVTWTSSDPEVITTTGEVSRPTAGADAATVVLTATVTVGEHTATREFEATVPAMPAAEPLEGYLFSYFVGEGYATGEQVYFGLSRGNDPLHYRNLNDNEPVLTSELGEKGLRDPFIIRSPEGDKFYQIATDLKIHGNGNWDASQRTGSRSIMVWESTDLVNWTDQRLVQVSPPEAGNTWAPEAYWDETIGAYVVFWASKLYAADDPQHTGNTHNRMLYTTTRDFHTFTEPQVWIDPGYSVIDSTVVKHDDTYYRFTKDERGSGACAKFIMGEKADELRSLDYEFIDECIGSGSISRGEGPTIFKDNEQDKWYMFIDEFGGRGYVPFETTDLDGDRTAWTVPASYEMPDRPRHGTVLPVTRAEYLRLLEAYQPDELVAAAEPVEFVVQVGTVPELPAEVSVTLADGTVGTAAVSWDAVDEAAFQEIGTVRVEGSFADAGDDVQAVAVITVQQDPVAVTSVQVDPSSASLRVGSSRQVAVTVAPATAGDKSLTWTSSDEAVATVTQQGRITAKAVGTATVKVVANGSAGGSVSATIAVRVTEDVTSGLLLRYEFEDLTSDTVADLSGNGNDGTLVGSPTQSEGINEQALALDGSNDHVVLPEGLLTDDDLTVATWVKWEAVGSESPWVWTLGTDRTHYLFHAPRHWSGGSAAGITTNTWNGEERATGAQLTGDWTHVAVTLADGKLQYWIDGELAGEVATSLVPSDLDDPADLISGYIGRSMYSEDPYLKGAVDDFRIYNRGLSAEEIELLAGTAVAPEPEPEPEPSEEPTDEPTDEPTEEPTEDPTDEPTEEPSEEPSPAPSTGPVDVYTTPGFHNSGGRWWHTWCEPYSQTVRCRTEIWSTQVNRGVAGYVQQTGWHFNNLTYLPRMTRAQWAGNPLAAAGEFTSQGRRWLTECDTAATGRGGCRSYIWGEYITSRQLPTGGWTHEPTEGWMFNNLVRFKQS